MWSWSIVIVIVIEMVITIVTEMVIVTVITIVTVIQCDGDLDFNVIVIELILFLTCPIQTKYNLHKYKWLQRDYEHRINYQKQNKTKH